MTPWCWRKIWIIQLGSPLQMKMGPPSNVWISWPGDRQLEELSIPTLGMDGVAE